MNTRRLFIFISTAVIFTMPATVKSLEPLGASSRSYIEEWEVINRVKIEIEAAEKEAKEAEEAAVRTVEQSEAAQRAAKIKIIGKETIEEAREVSKKEEAIKRAKVSVKQAIEAKEDRQNIEKIKMELAEARVSIVIKESASLQEVLLVRASLVARAEAVIERVVVARRTASKAVKEAGKAAGIVSKTAVIGEVFIEDDVKIEVVRASLKAERLSDLAVTAASRANSRVSKAKIMFE